MPTSVTEIEVPTADAPARDVLTRDEAIERAARVSNAGYHVQLDLVAGRSTYRGETTLTFDIEGNSDISLGLRGRTIELLEINGRAVEPDWNGYKVTLPGQLLAPRTTVRVVYENDYDTTGDGFHRFVDPEDGAEYVYSNFEPFEAHRLFPCFDQPDIKGTYLIEVTAPADWEMVSNYPVAQVTDVAGGRRHHRFERTPPFSTYLVALIGGPYAVRRRDHNGVAMGIYARRSLEHLLDDQHHEMFDITTQGLDFYARLFDRPFPFAKYDQLFVPEYNSGAMENVGAVTFNEAYLFRDPPTDNQRLDRAEVVLHELAHMWFGDLVTMRWWNDLWLNESFATYISYLALTSATRFRNAWKVFNADIKRWAYQTDQLVTTHPISGEAADTEEAFLNFDGITYGKGAAVLKQLAHHIGADGFRDGMRLYFRRHEFGNATLRDFLACLAEGSGQSLDEWARLWLETASLNAISADVVTHDGRIARLRLNQSAPHRYPTLRPHALTIGLGHERDGRLEVASVPTRIEGAVADVPEAVGLPAPALVFPNHDDYDYARVLLDAVSTDYVREHFDRIGDPLLRQLLWMALWEMVRDARLSSPDYLAIAWRWMPTEPDLDILASVLQRATIVLTRYVPETLRAAELDTGFQAALAALAAPAPDGEGGDRRIEWARAAIAFAGSADSAGRLVEALDTGIGGFSFDQEMRWAIATRAVAFGLPGAEKQLEIELARDRSDRGQRAVITARAASPTPSVKEATWARIHGAGYGSLQLTSAAMRGFLWPHQVDTLAPYEAAFFERVEEIFATRDHPFARAYMVFMYPAHRASPAVLERSRALLGSLDGRLPTLARQLAEAVDELERTIRIRKFAESQS
jgi:aminopeptidase N